MFRYKNQLTKNKYEGILQIDQMNVYTKCDNRLFLMDFVSNMINLRESITNLANFTKQPHTKKLWNHAKTRSITEKMARDPRRLD